MAANIHDHLTDQLFKAILSLKDEEQCYKFFEDICTISELKAMAQRLEVARIQFLRFGQGFGFPVGKALAFRNLFPEEDGIYLLQAFILDAESADVFLQFNARMLFERSTLVQHHEVIPQGKAYFRYTWVFQQCDNRQSQSRQVEAEQKAMFL